MTMGAMRRFKRITGKDVSELDGKASVDDIITLMYCSVASACNADEVAFDMDEEKFADCVGLEDVEAFSIIMNQKSGEAQEAKKKK